MRIWSTPGMLLQCWWEWKYHLLGKTKVTHIPVIWLSFSAFSKLVLKKFSLIGIGNRLHCVVLASAVQQSTTTCVHISSLLELSHNPHPISPLSDVYLRENENVCPYKVLYVTNFHITPTGNNSKVHQYVSCKTKNVDHPHSRRTLSNKRVS